MEYFNKNFQLECNGWLPCWYTPSCFPPVTRSLHPNCNLVSNFHDRADRCTRIVIVDGLGHEITLETPAQRILSLAPSNTEILFAIGAGKQVSRTGLLLGLPPGSIGPFGCGRRFR